MINLYLLLALSLSVRSETVCSYYNPTVCSMVRHQLGVFTTRSEFLDPDIRNQRQNSE